MRSSLLLPYRDHSRFTALAEAGRRWDVAISELRAMVVWINGEARWRVERRRESAA